MSTIGEKFIAANKFDDFFEGYSQDFANDETERFREWVTREYPGEYSPSPQNVKTFAQFFESNSIPYTVRNLSIAFIYLRAEGLLEEAPVETEPEFEPRAKYSGPVVERIVQSPDEQRAAADEIKRLRQLDSTPRSRKKTDVGQELRREYQQSLQDNRHGGKKRHMSPGEARASAATTFPELAGKPESADMNLWSARLQFNQYSDD